LHGNQSNASTPHLYHPASVGICCAVILPPVNILISCIGECTIIARKYLCAGLVGTGAATMEAAVNAGAAGAAVQGTRLLMATELNDYARDVVVGWGPGLRVQLHESVAVKIMRGNASMPKPCSWNWCSAMPSPQLASSARLPWRTGRQSMRYRCLELKDTSSSLVFATFLSRLCYRAFFLLSDTLTF
jgi:hypothetical protein